MQSRCENRYSNRLLADGTDGTAVAASPGIIPIIIAGEEIEYGNSTAPSFRVCNAEVMSPSI